MEKIMEKTIFGKKTVTNEENKKDHESDRAFIETTNLSFSYTNGQKALEQISFRADEGESIGLAGANGAGKSTLLKLLAGLHLSYTGNIRINGLSVIKKNLPGIREKTGYIFQDSDHQLFMSTVYEDVAFAPRNYGLTEKEVSLRTMEALSFVHCVHLKDRRIHQMSGGEKKLISIATVLSMRPQILLMDEPSAALDPKNRRNLIKLLNEFSQIKLIASHDLDFLLDTCSRVILIDQGKIISDSSARTVLSDKNLLEAHGLELPLSLYNTLS